MFTQKPKQAVPIFNVRKKFSRKVRVIKILETLLIVSVIIGTLGWLLISANFSPPQFLSGVFERLKPQVTVEKKQSNQGPEEQFKSVLSEEGYKVERFIVNEDFYEVTMEGGLNVFFSTKKGLENEVATLQTLVSKAKIDNRNLKKVDFRFEKIIVEYQ